MKNLRAIILLLTANSISGVAQGISMFAVPWYVLSESNGASWFGQVYLFATIVSSIWVLYAGSLIDRYDRKHIFLVINGCGAAVVGAVSIVGWTQGYLPDALVVSVFMCTFWVYNIHFPNLYAFAQEISEPRDYARITSWLEVQHQTTSAISGGLAAVLLSGVHLPWLHIPSWSLTGIFTLDAVSYLIAFVLLAAMRYKPVSQRDREEGRPLQRFTQGMRFLRREPRLLLFGCVSYGVFITILVMSFYLVPLYIDQHLQIGVEAYAWYHMLYAVGAVTSGLLVRHLFRRHTVVAGVAVLTTITAMAYVLCASTSSALVFYHICFLLGLCNSAARILRTTFIFRTVPNQLIGRASGVFHQFHILFRILFIGLFSLPFFTRDGHVTVALYILAGFVVIASALLWLNISGLTALIRGEQHQK